MKEMQHSSRFLNTTTLISVTAILSIINGVAYLVFPNFSVGVLGIRPDGYGLHNTRYYGACAIGYGILLWLIRDTESKKVTRAVLLSILVILGISSILGIIGVIDGVTNQYGLLLVTTDLFLSLGSMYLLVKERKR